MIIGLVVLAALAAAAYWAWPKDSTPECVMHVTEYEQWYVYSDGSVSESEYGVIVDDCAGDSDVLEVSDIGEWS